MKTLLHSILVLLFVSTLAGCATSLPQAPVSVVLAPNPLGSNAPSAGMPPMFADAELQKLPGVKESMDKCRELGKKHKVGIRLLETGSMKGNMIIDITCDG